MAIDARGNGSPTFARELRDVDEKQQFDRKKDGVFYVALPNNFAKEWVEGKYQKNILSILRARDESIKKVEFVVGGETMFAKKQVPVVTDTEIGNGP